MAATARLIVMMEEDEKARLEARAAAAKVSTAEFVRRSLFSRVEPEEQAFLQTLAALKPLVRRACRTIDDNLGEIRAVRDSGHRQDARIAARVRRELTRGELAKIADRLSLARGPSSSARRRGARS